MYCCNTLKQNITDERIQIFYDKKFREYYIWGNKERTVWQILDFCPFCGNKFPNSLRNEWYDILEDEFKIEDPCNTESNKIPHSFLSDTWWKKRDL